MCDINTQPKLLDGDLCDVVLVTVPIDKTLSAPNLRLHKCEPSHEHLHSGPNNVFFDTVPQEPWVTARLARMLVATRRD